MSFINISESTLAKRMQVTMFRFFSSSKASSEELPNLRIERVTISRYNNTYTTYLTFDSTVEVKRNIPDELIPIKY
jgi:hypothetical protein